MEGKIIKIELDDDVLLQLCLFAHEKDITLNVLINDILREYIKKNGVDKVSTNEVNKDDVTALDSKVFVD